MKSYKVKIGLWIDLCNTSRFYNRKEVEELGAKYVKLQCRGHGETPSQDQVRKNFVKKDVKALSLTLKQFKIVK
jgi:mRNA-capping enzyme